MASPQGRDVTLNPAEQRAILKVLERIDSPAAIRKAIDSGAIPNLGSAVAKLGNGSRQGK